MQTDSGRCSLHAVVSGSVQGVFFRMFVLNEARKLGVLGTVRNVGDRDVEVRAEGDRAQLEALVERLRKGPPRAQVADVRTDWGEYLREFDDFHIEY